MPISKPIGLINHHHTHLRLIYLLLKLGLTFIAADLFGLSAPPALIYVLFFFEAVYVGLSFCFKNRYQYNEPLLFMSLVIDSLLLAAWLYLTGGATNAFISLLLLPIAVAAVALPQWAPWGLTLISTASYSLMIFVMPEHNMGDHTMDMRSHFLGMWFNFLISALIVTTSIAFIARKVRQKEAELNILREAQLRQEKLLALGTASAQMAHQLATPLASLRLLVDELHENQPVDGVLPDIEQALCRCEQTLTDLRSATQSIRENQQTNIIIPNLVDTLTQQILLLMPEVSLTTQIDINDNTMSLNMDTNLLPALMSLIENAARASHENNADYQVELSATIDNQYCCLSIRDFGTGISADLIAQIGENIIHDAKGMGVSLLLSHASLERLGGSLILHQHSDGGTVAKVLLPLKQAPTTFSSTVSKKNSHG
ncbi:HAMP domain-containing sensor histidine kinase [Shewanella sp. ULN5]|uniref:sensor histidine kinase n=1 Tax=Shewanella sp. ULN5 TaxID=2994678 RepID=UPI00273FFD06|nr:HAMP domain-containing sensor histidine kinase [Shewanella sp. ULN5]MDP5146393.1 HAMP domain-containing sensor histidine kinase [Shewanella sp. ULN5]